MIRHIPLGPFQEAVYKILTENQTTRVYNIPTFDLKYPCISLRLYKINPGGAKNVDISEISIEIGLHSSYKGIEEIAGILSDVVNVLTNVPIDLSADNYDLISADIQESQVEPIADKNMPEIKYTGFLIFTAKIQYIGG